MTTQRKTLFISDLHLEENQPVITERFLRLLNDCQNNHVEALYILGDLFEAWIGDDDDTLFHRKIIQALKSATLKGLAIYFLRGNRDFLIGKKFMHQTGCQLLADETKITLYGTPVLLLHGDTLCTQDVVYLRWRKLARNPIINRLCFSFWPLKLRKKFADKMRAESKLHTQNIAKEIMDVTQTEVERVMQQHDVRYLIHGHTHRPNKHLFMLQGEEATRFVLGAWHGESAVVLSWDEQGKKELILK